MNVQLLPVSAIINNSSFRYRVKQQNRELAKSVSRAGILHPLFAVSAEEGLVLIDGFQRYELALLHQSKEIPVRIFENDEAAGSFLAGIQSNLGGSGMSMLEKLGAIQVAGENFGAETRGQVSEMLELKRVPKIMDLVNRVANLPERFRIYFHNIDLQIKMLDRLTRLSLEDFKEWFVLAENLNLKGAELMNLLEQVEDICLRDSISSRNLFNKLEMQNILKSGMTPQQKSNRTKNVITEMRFPILTDIRSLLSTHSGEIERQFSGAVKIGWDKSLERPGIELKVKFPNRKSIDEILLKLNSELIRKRLKALFDEMNQIPEEALK